MAKTPASSTSGATPNGKTSGNAGKPSGPATSQKRETLVSLRKHVDEIAARLKQADELTQQSVGSLQNAFYVLEKRVSETNTVNKAALTRRVDQLSNHLTGLIADTRTAVAKDLKSVQNNPSEARLRSALEAAETRIANTEIAQAAALTKVNRHIADLARAIDSRLSHESTLRSDALTRITQNVQSLQDRTQRKIQDVEQSSADAIIRIGEQVMALSNDFRVRTDKNAQAISAKMSDIAVSTQREFEDYKSQFERRLESIEENQRNLDSYTDRTLSGMSTRIDNLEYGLTSMAPPPAATPQAPLEPLGSDAFSPAPTPAHATPPVDEPLILEIEKETPQLTLVTSPALSPSQLPHPKPVAPVEYVPEAATHAGAATISPYALDNVPAPAQPYVPPPQSEGSGPQLYVASDNPFTQEYSPNASDRAVADLIGAEDLPYSDPAYAENLAPDNMKRPGAFESLKAKSKTGPKVSARNLRVAGMALLVATVSYFALRGALNRPDQSLAGNQSSPSIIMENSDGGLAPLASIGSTDAPAASTAPAIGEYVDNQGLNPAGAQIVPETLEAAAKAGDAVAEFQLGLARLESGQTDEAITLIRAAANKGQPAAQYRLAKLYEAGEGVAADSQMARQLTERAATNGNRIAMHDIALYYAEGRGGVDVNIQQAAGWFEKAAQRGVVDSQYNLGVLYESGQGLPKNLTEAYVWYSIAAGQGDQFARKHIDVLKQQISASDLQRADNRAAEFKPLALDEPANGIFRNVSWAQPKTEKDAKANIEEAQLLLAQLGYDAGQADGSVGPKTNDAIIKFQRDNKLTQTGAVDAQLIHQLQRAAGA